MNAQQLLANATIRLRVITHTDHTCARANLDISEMGGIVQVPSIVSKVFRLFLTSILSSLHVRQSRVENRHDLQSLTR